MGGTFKETLDYIVVPLPFVVLIMLALLDGRSNAYMHNKILVLLGESSFALYLIHKPIAGYVSQALNANLQRSGLISAVLMFLAIGLSIGASTLFYKYIEKPVTGRLKVLINTKIG